MLNKNEREKMRESKTMMDLELEAHKYFFHWTFWFLLCLCIPAAIGFWIWSCQKERQIREKYGFTEKKEYRDMSGGYKSDTLSVVLWCVAVPLIIVAGLILIKLVSEIVK